MYVSYDQCLRRECGTEIEGARLSRASSSEGVTKGRLVFWGLLCLHIALLGGNIVRYSPVQSEVAHLASGVAHLRAARFDLYRVNPPLVRCLGATPVLLLNPVMDARRFGRNVHERHEHQGGVDFSLHNAFRTRTLLCVARWTCIVFSVCGFCLCYQWALRLFGKASACIAATMWCLSPYILGVGSTIMCDVGAASVGTAAMYCFWSWLKSPRWPEAIIAGLVLGLAELCKFTLLVLDFLLPVLWVAYWISDRRNIESGSWLRQGAMLAASLLISVCVINCGYLFEGTLTPLGDFQFQSSLFTGREDQGDSLSESANRFADTWLGRVPLPLPANMVQGIDTQRHDFERGLPSYLGGTWSNRGWWHYYLYALAVKVPIGTWCLVVLAVGVTLIGRGYSASMRDEMVLLAPGLVILLLVSSQTGFSVHSRYVIPALPFLFIWASKVGRVFEMRAWTWQRRLLGTLAATAITWSVTSSLWIYPHSLSYFNEIAGSPRHGAEHLLNSNIDWGQDLHYLRGWLDDHPNVRLDGLACFGSYPASLAGIPDTPRPPRTWEATGGNAVDAGPQPGWYVLSLNSLYSKCREYRCFLRFEPVATAGYSIFIYHITLEDANRVRRELRQPLLRDDRPQESTGP